MGGRVIDGEMTLAEARARFNLKMARRGEPPLEPLAAAVVKMAGSSPRQVWENYSDPLARERAWEAMALKSAPADAPVPARPAHYWTPRQQGLLNEYRMNPSPQARESARAALEAEGIVI